MRRNFENCKRVLVTGGAGFLGSHEVVCVDNLFTGSKHNIEHLHANARFEFLRHDITFPLYVEVDEIYNLACPASPVQYQHDPVQTVGTRRDPEAIGRVAINGQRRPAQALRSGRAARVETSVLVGCGSLKDGLVSFEPPAD
jgi:nucleoside-diphosphate-sugar epimerase